MSELSLEAKRVLQALDEKQIKAIQKDNPKRVERDGLICKLRRQGVKFPVLAEITGMSTTGLHHIVKRQNRDTKKVPYSRNRSPNKLKAVFKTFSRLFYSVLNNAQGKGGVKG